MSPWYATTSPLSISFPSASSTSAPACINALTNCDRVAGSLGAAVGRVFMSLPNREKVVEILTIVVRDSKRVCTFKMSLQKLGQLFPIHLFFRLSIQDLQHRQLHIVCDMFDVAGFRNCAIAHEAQK
eukprot:GHVT01000536.1.p3 GENE.GHVT01000536.1~~GHVT01000536.1.p3  ORF type:complete len:127 (-),score=5.80 GHVT01000536.1:1452-1832(-)